MIEMREKDLDALIERAAYEGARKALSEVGLSDEHAGSDIRDLRGLLAAWRVVSKTTLETTARTLTVLVLALLALGLSFKFGFKIGHGG